MDCGNDLCNNLSKDVDVRRGFTIGETSWCAIGLPIEINRSGTRVGRLGVKDDHIS